MLRGAKHSIEEFEVAENHWFREIIDEGEGEGVWGINMIKHKHNMETVWILTKGRWAYFWHKSNLGSLSDAL